MKVSVQGTLELAIDTVDTSRAKKKRKKIPFEFYKNFSKTFYLIRLAVPISALKKKIVKTSHLTLYLLLKVHLCVKTANYSRMSLDIYIFI